MLKNKYIKFGLYGVIGGLIGYSYYYFVGCTNGCPLSSNWYITTGYGLISGLVLAIQPKKKETENNENPADI